jgi:opacity protein-like surface antigen
MPIEEIAMRAFATLCLCCGLATSARAQSPAVAATPARPAETITATPPPPAPAAPSAAAEPAAASTPAAAVPSANGAATDDELGLGLGVKVGGLLPTSQLDMTYLLAADLSIRPPVWGRRLGLGVEVLYAQPGNRGTITGPSTEAFGGAVKYDLSLRLLGLTVEAFVRDHWGELTPYAGIGYGFYFLRSEIRALGDTATESQSRTGMQLRGGAGHRLGPGEVFAELRYHWVALRFDATGRANAGALTVAAGYRLVL